MPVDVSKAICLATVMIADAVCSDVKFSDFNCSFGQEENSIIKQKLGGFIQAYYGKAK